jgi:hypothetical protein
MRKTYALFAVYQSIFHLKIRITYIYISHDTHIDSSALNRWNSISFSWANTIFLIRSFSICAIVHMNQARLSIILFVFFLCNFSILVYYRFITHATSIVWWVSYGLSSSSSSSFFLSYSSTTRRKKNDKWI